MNIEFDVKSGISENHLILLGDTKYQIDIEVSGEISPARAVWEKWRLLKNLRGDRLTVQGPEGFRSSFQYQIAVFIARVLIVLQNDYELNAKIGASDSPLDTHLPAICGIGFPDSDVFGHGLAQLASYAQAEWTGAYIPCPLEKRLYSLFVALLRTCSDESSLYGNGPLGMVAVLFQSSLVASSTNKPHDRAIIKALGDLCGAPPSHPISPHIGGIFDNNSFVLSNHYWLKSLLERLRVDRDAYKRDAARARKDYSALIGVAEQIVPVETIRIECPESLLFDLWAGRDYESSKEHKGFPLAWIDNGWSTRGFELHLNSSQGDLLKPLAQQVADRGLPSGGRLGNGGWSLTYADDATTRSNVRFGLKCRLFPDKAEVVAKAISLKELACSRMAKKTPISWHGDHVLLDQAIRESEPEDNKKGIPAQFSSYKFGVDAYLWAEVEFADINIYETWAGDEIAAILYSLLRPAAEMTLPNDFLQHHVHRSPGMVYAWAREGMVVAYQKGRAKDALPGLKNALQEAATLESELAALIKGSALSAPLHSQSCSDDCTSDDSKNHADTAETVPREDRVQAVIHKHIDLRQRAAQPDLRALRGFLDRRHAQEIYDAFRQSEADTNQLKTLESMEQSSNRLDWLEAVLFAFAITEAGHILGEAVLPKAWVGITIGASILGLIAAGLFLFTSQKRRPVQPLEKAGKGLLILVFAIVYLGALLLWFIHPADHSEVSKPASVPVCPVCTLPSQPAISTQSNPASARAAAQPATNRATVPAKPKPAKP